MARYYGFVRIRKICPSKGPSLSFAEDGQQGISVVDRGKVNSDIDVERTGGEA